MQRRRRRETEVFSLSFLDCICCGFGAMILLLVLAAVQQPIILEKTESNLGGQVAKLQQELYTIRGESEVLNRELKGRIEQVSSERLRLARLAGDLSTTRGQYAASQKDADFTNKLQQDLVATFQRLNAEQQKMLANYRPQRGSSVAGIPADSQYVVFVIDTSGSMQQNHWSTMLRKMQEILDLYPQVKGLQVMDDEGKYLFPTTAARWLSDSAERRKVILDAMQNWVTYSNSSPIEGLVQAIDDFGRDGKKVSVYYMGDDFTGPSIQDALDQIARLNAGPRGERRVRIHALGFPMPPGEGDASLRRYAQLMRLVCEENGGAFVGLAPGSSERRKTRIIFGQ
jgi:hypothetical protein